MVRGKAISFNSKFREKLFDLIHDNYFSGDSPYYSDFDIQIELAREVSKFLSAKVNERKDEISQEEPDIAASLHRQYEPFIRHSQDLAFKSIYIMIYSSFENCLNKIKELLIEQLLAKEQSNETQKTTTGLLLNHLLKKRKFKFNDLLDLFSCISLLEKGTMNWEKVKNLNKIRNMIAHNDSIVKDNEDNRKNLKPAIKKYEGIEFNESSFELRITDIKFLYDSIDAFQAILDEIYQNSGKIGNN